MWPEMLRSGSSTIPQTNRVNRVTNGVTKHVNHVTKRLTNRVTNPVTTRQPCHQPSRRCHKTLKRSSGKEKPHQWQHRRLRVWQCDRVLTWVHSKWGRVRAMHKRTSVCLNVLGQLRPAIRPWYPTMNTCRLSSVFRNNEDEGGKLWASDFWELKKNKGPAGRQPTVVGLSPTAVGG